MTTSPYDNLPIGNDEKPPKAEPESSTVDIDAESETIDAAAVDIEAVDTETKAADTVGYVEVDLEDSAPEQNDSQQQNEIIEHTPPAPASQQIEIREPEKQKPEQQPTLPHSRQEARSFAKTAPLDNAPRYSSLKLNNRCGIREYILPFEESLLVPDTMPDMSEILFAEGRASLTPSGKNSYQKNDFLSGEILLYTVYKPDTKESSPVDVVKSTITFKTDKCWNSAEGDSFRADVVLKTANTEMINERKFTAKGEILIRFTDITSKELSVFKGVDDSAFVQLEDTLKAADLSFETEETTEISQQINIKEDQPSPIKILKQNIEIIENHKQITSGKLVINATANCSILYVGEEDGESRLGSITNKTDFTQFIAMKGDEDVSLIQTCFAADDLKISIEGSEEFLLQGQVHTFIQGYKNREIRMVADAYHKERDIDFDISQQPLSHVTGTVSGEITAREVINLQDSDKKPNTLICGSSSLGSIKAGSERGRIIIEGTMLVKVLALDEDNVPFVITSEVPLRGSLELPAAGDDFTTDVLATVREFWFDEINSRQLEINVSVAINVWMNGTSAFKTMENLCFVEKKEPAKRIPMAIYVVNRDDTLWDIAKRYKSDVDSLAELNQIDALRPLPEGMKLFVMK